MAAVYEELRVFTDSLPKEVDDAYTAVDSFFNERTIENPRERLSIVNQCMNAFDDSSNPAIFAAGDITIGQAYEMAKVVLVDGFWRKFI